MSNQVYTVYKCSACSTELMQKGPIVKLSDCPHPHLILIGSPFKSTINNWVLAPNSNPGGGSQLKSVAGGVGSVFRSQRSHVETPTKSTSTQMPPKTGFPTSSQFVQQQPKAGFACASPLPPQLQPNFAPGKRNFLATETRTSTSSMLAQIPASVAEIRPSSPQDKGEVGVPDSQLHQASSQPQVSMDNTLYEDMDQIINVLTQSISADSNNTKRARMDQ